jgi:murein L,D-transpeptidase YcbB/YkuD
MPSLHARTRLPVVIAVASMGAFAYVSPLGAQDAGMPPGLADAIRDRVEAVGTWGSIAAGEPLRSGRALSEFYRARGFAPAWVEGGRAAARADTLVERVRASSRHALDPEHYHLYALVALAQRLRTSGTAVPQALLVDADVLLTDAFLELGHHLMNGRVDPVTVNPEWGVPHDHGRSTAMLLAAFDGRGVALALEGLAPPQAEYGRLVEALAALRERAAAGGWPNVPVGPTLRPGDRHERVAAVRARLRAERSWVGEAPDPTTDPGPHGATDPTSFDASLLAAVVHFQRRHGLEPDGVVDAGTVSAMNVPVEDRITQVEGNLERWRWLPRTLGERHVRINIPAFSAHVFQGDSVVLRVRASVGRECREAPMFSADLTQIVFAPYWHVPPTIAAEDHLPSIKHDPGYVAAQRMTLRSTAADRPVDPASVDWSAMTGERFNREYRLRQDPGPWNALGDVKFVLPNEHDVSLHDTPARELLRHAVRHFSPGCIRVDQPLRLAGWLLRDRPEWTQERMRAVMAGGSERTVDLAEPVPVHILYWTAFVDPDLGSVGFGADLYGRDARLRRALASAPPF